MFAILPLLYKGAAIGAAAWGSNKLMRKGEELIEEGGGLGGVFGGMGEQLTDAVARLDVLDITGLNRAKAAKEEQERDRERRQDKKSTEKKLKKVQKQQQQQLAALQKQQQEELARLNRDDNAEDAAMRADFERRMAEQQAAFNKRIDEMAAANAAELRQVKDGARRQALMQSRRNLMAARVANQKASLPDASSAAVQLMEAVRGMVMQQGSVPDAGVYQEQGIDIDEVMSNPQKAADVGLDFLW